MTALVQIETTKLAQLEQEIRAQGRGLVEGVWRIGKALNDGRALFVDNASFHEWREPIINDLGISRRTARRMQDIAEKFTLASLPNVGVSSLYAIASDSVGGDEAQQALLRLCAARVADGNPMTTSEVTTYVSKLHNSKINFVDIKRDAISIESRLAVANGESPALIEALDEVGDPIEAELVPAPRRAAQAARQDCKDQAEREAEQTRAALDWAAGVRRHLRSKSKRQRREALNALLCELRRAHMLIDNDHTVHAVDGPDGQPRIEVND